jgi:branched-chain amino acid transport system substrate-binding protein
MKSKAGIALLLVAAAASAVVAGSTAATDSARGPQAASSADRVLVRCGTRVRVGIAAPITGQVASLGSQQLGWAQFFVSRWNRFHKLKVTLVQGDTQLPDTAAALRAAQQLAGNSAVLGVVGPAGSQEVVVSSPPFKARGAGFVSGSATRTTLTQEPVRRGYFFRVVPPDSVQSTSVANYVAGTRTASGSRTRCRRSCVRRTSP